MPEIFRDVELDVEWWLRVFAPKMADDNVIVVTYKNTHTRERNAGGSVSKIMTKMY